MVNLFFRGGEQCWSGYGVIGRVHVSGLVRVHEPGSAKSASPMLGSDELCMLIYRAWPDDLFCMSLTRLGGTSGHPNKRTRKDFCMQPV